MDTICIVRVRFASERARKSLNATSPPPCVFGIGWRHLVGELCSNIVFWRLKAWSWYKIGMILRNSTFRTFFSYFCFCINASVKTICCVFGRQYIILIGSMSWKIADHTQRFANSGLVVFLNDVPLAHRISFIVRLV